MASACVLVECPITGRVLGVARRDDPNAWGLPGGKLEDGEREWDCAVRELKEETGIVAGLFALKEVFRREGGVTFRLMKPFRTENGVGGIAYVQPQAPGEPRCDWVTWQQLFDGPFGEYNRKLYAALGRSHQGA